MGKYQLSEYSILYKIEGPVMAISLFGNGKVYALMGELEGEVYALEVDDHIIAMNVKNFHKQYIGTFLDRHHGVIYYGPIVNYEGFVECSSFDDEESFLMRDDGIENNDADKKDNTGCPFIYKGILQKEKFEGKGWLSVISKQTKQYFYYNGEWKDNQYHGEGEFICTDYYPEDIPFKKKFLKSHCLDFKNIRDLVHNSYSEVKDYTEKLKLSWETQSTNRRMLIFIGKFENCKPRFGVLLSNSVDKKINFDCEVEDVEYQPIVDEFLLRVGEFTKLVGTVTI